MQKRKAMENNGKKKNYRKERKQLRNSNSKFFPYISLNKHELNFLTKRKNYWIIETKSNYIPSKEIDFVYFAFVFEVWRIDHRIFCSVLRTLTLSVHRYLQKFSLESKTSTDWILRGVKLYMRKQQWLFLSQVK